MTRRFPKNDFDAQLRLRIPKSRPSFVAMVIAEWHKLVADMSRPFARRRIHRAAEEIRQAKARVTPLRPSSEKPPD